MWWVVLVRLLRCLDAVERYYKTAKVGGVNEKHASRVVFFVFFFSSRRRHTRLQGDWSSDVCSSDLGSSSLRNTSHQRLARTTDDASSRDKRHNRVAAEVSEAFSRGISAKRRLHDRRDRKSVV